MKRFKENETFKNVVQPSREEITAGFEWQGKWATFFGNENPITLELGCGKGEYTVALARKYPERNFIGIDIKGSRFWRGAKTAIADGLDNVAFLRTQIELVDYAFAKAEIAEIWITFPDPQITYKRTKHRMTNPEFLDKYRKILQPDGVIHLKTDSEYMHGYTLGLLEGLGEEILYAHHNIYTNTEAPAEVIETQTFYEKQYLEVGKAITYMKFKLRE